MQLYMKDQEEFKVKTRIFRTFFKLLQNSVICLRALSMWVYDRRLRHLQLHRQCLAGLKRLKMIQISEIYLSFFSKMEFLLVKAPPNIAEDFLMSLLDILAIFINFPELFCYSFKGLREALIYNSITIFKFRGDWQMCVWTDNLRKSI